MNKIFGQLLLWEGLNKFLLNYKKRRIYKFESGFAGLNIGCGLENPNNWYGIDGGITHYLFTKMPKFILKQQFRKMNMSRVYTFDNYYTKIKKMRLIHHDLSYLLPFQNNSIPNIYSSHFFEHITISHAQKLLKDCYDKLLVGGIIRICVPDLENVVSEIKSAIIEYDKGNILPVQKFTTSKYEGYISYYSHHQYLYNYQDLSKLLQEIGFINIVKQSFRKGNIPNVEQLDTRNGLFVEAVK